MALVSKVGAGQGNGLFMEFDEERDRLEKELLREQVTYFKAQTKLAEAQMKLAESQSEQAERHAEVLGLEAFLKSNEWERVKHERSMVVAEIHNLDGGTTKVTLEELLMKERIARAERTIRADVREAAQEKTRQQHRRQDNSGQQARGPGRMQPYRGKRDDKPRFTNAIKGAKALENLTPQVEQPPEHPQAQ